jgi:Ca2+-binding RTX toxin-like protein
MEFWLEQYKVPTYHPMVAGLGSGAWGIRSYGVLLTATASGQSIIVPNGMVANSYISNFDAPPQESTYTWTISSTTETANIYLPTYMWVDLRPAPSNGLFTTGADTVDVNNLTAAQQQAIAAGADTTHGLGGNDSVTLPNSGDATFYTGSTASDTNYQVTGGGGNYTIFEGAGTENISINGDGSSNITAGSGTDAISIRGNGNNAITGGLGTDNVTINGTGDSIITRASGTLNATISGGGTVELTSTATPVTGSITFAPATAPTTDNESRSTARQCRTA